MKTVEEWYIVRHSMKTNDSKLGFVKEKDFPCDKGKIEWHKHPVAAGTLTVDAEQEHEFSRVVMMDNRMQKRHGEGAHRTGTCPVPYSDDGDR